MPLKLSLYGLSILLIFCAGLGSGYRLFSKSETVAPPLKVSDNSLEKKSGTITVYLPSKCDGKPQEIASVEVFNSEKKNDVKSDPVMILPDNLDFDSDLKSEIGFKYRPFDNIPILNKLKAGADYDILKSELRGKIGFSIRFNP